MSTAELEDRPSTADLDDDETAATTRATNRLAPGHVIARVAASLLGGWIFVWGLIAGGVATLLSLGMSFDDARNLTHLLAFLVYLTAVCWAFVAPRLLLVCAVLFGGGAAMTGLAWLLTRPAG
jgi:hypothetical protein